MKRRDVLLFSSALVLGGTATAQVGPATSWTGGTGNWFDPAKWTGDRPGSFRPPDTTTVFRALTNWQGPYYDHSKVTINTGTATLLSSPTTVYNMSGDPEQRYSLTYFVDVLGIPSLVIGETGTGTLNLLGGIFLSPSDITLGQEPGSAGVLNTTGAPIHTTNITCSGHLMVGKNGIGRLNVIDGSQVEYYDNVHQFEWLVSTWNNYIGYGVGANGAVKVTGAGSKLYYTTTGFSAGPQKTNGMLIGLSGVGLFQVEAGGTALTRAARLGVYGGGQGFGSVTGAGSLWDNDAQFYIGESGQGSLLITNGGHVRSGYGGYRMGTTVLVTTGTNMDEPVPVKTDHGSIGTNAGADGTVTLNGAGSLWENNANLVVGGGGTGRLTIEGGGKVISGKTSETDINNATIGLNAGSDGTVKVSGVNARWQNSSPITVGNAGTGRLIVGNGGQIDAPANSTIAVGYASSGSGTIIFGGSETSGVGTLGGGTIQGGLGTSLVQFTHNQTYTPFHTFQSIGTLENNGPGTTVLTGQLHNVGNLRATKGTMELTNAGGNPTIRSITLNGGTLNLKALNLTLDSGTLLDGAILSGTLNLSQGTQLTGALGISGSGSTLTVDGAGTKFIPRKPPLSSNFVVGDGGGGSLVLRNGGQVPVNPATLVTTVGYQAGSSGNISITGLSSELSAGAFTLGRQGTGQVVMDTFAALATDGALLGDLPGSSGSAIVRSSSFWRIAQPSMTLGRQGAGRLEISGGGSVRVGPTGAGVIQATVEQGSSATIQIGTGTAPGNLHASAINSGPYTSTRLNFHHNSNSYEFAVALDEADIRVLDGNTGTTTLSRDVRVGSIGITTGGLRIAGDGHVFCSGGTLAVGDVSSQNPGGGYVAPFLIVDGNEATLDTDALVIGQAAEAAVTLKNSSITTVGRLPNYAEIPLNGTFTFGGNGDMPGDLLAAGIRGTANDDKVVFDHRSSTFYINCALLGPLSVEHRNIGTTSLNGTNSQTGPTTISGGNLLFPNGQLGSTITVSGTGAVGGAGTLGRVTLQSGGSISPGGGTAATAIGTQRVGVFTLAAGSKLRIDLGPNGTCDTILNNTEPGLYIDTVLNFPASGNVIVDFRFRGINGNGVYPFLTRPSALTTDQLSRLTATSNFPLQGYFQQTRVGSGFTARYQVEYVVTSFGSPAYDLWLAEHGLNPSTTGLPGEDPDHDGRKNMLEFLLGSSPVSGRSERTPTLTRSGNTATFRFNRRLYSETLFTPAVQYSTDLGAWTDATPAMLSSAPSGLEGFETVTATLPIPANAPKFFTRLKISTISP